MLTMVNYSLIALNLGGAIMAIPKYDHFLLCKVMSTCRPLIMSQAKMIDIPVAESEQPAEIFFHQISDELP